MKYWQDIHTLAVQCYITGDTVERNYVYNNYLYDVIFRIIQQNEKLLYCRVDEDMESCAIEKSLHLLNTIEISKVQASLQYMWVCLRNYIITYKKNENKRQIKYACLDNIDTMDNITNEEDIEDIVPHIINEIDSKIYNSNDDNVIHFLIALKEWALKCDYNVNGFVDYYMLLKGINKYKMYQLFRKTGIHSRIFFKKKQKKNVL